MPIDWTNPRSPISRFFTVHEATFLPSWAIHHTPSDAEKEAILRTALWMDRVRDLLMRPIDVHCWIRPTSVNCPGTPHHGENYNAFKGGASHSAHILGRAVDFDAGKPCHEDREILLPKLEALGLRMEDREGPWIHLDDMPVLPGHARFFKP